MSERWVESVDREEYLVCDCGRMKPPGMLWGIIPRRAMVKVFAVNPIAYQTCPHCKKEARLANETKAESRESDSFDPGI